MRFHQCDDCSDAHVQVSHSLRILYHLLMLIQDAVRTLDLCWTRPTVICQRWHINNHRCIPKQCPFSRRFWPGKMVQQQHYAPSSGTPVTRRPHWLSIKASSMPCTSFSGHRCGLRGTQNETRSRNPLLALAGGLLGHSSVKPRPIGPLRQKDGTQYTLDTQCISLLDAVVCVQSLPFTDGGEHIQTHSVSTHSVCWSASQASRSRATD